MGSAVRWYDRAVSGRLAKRDGDVVLDRCITQRAGRGRAGYGLPAGLSILLDNRKATAVFGFAVPINKGTEFNGAVDSAAWPIGADPQMPVSGTGQAALSHVVGPARPATTRSEIKRAAAPLLAGRSDSRPALGAAPTRRSERSEMPTAVARASSASRPGAGAAGSRRLVAGPVLPPSAQATSQAASRAATMRRRVAGETRSWAPTGESRVGRRADAPVIAREMLLRPLGTGAANLAAAVSATGKIDDKARTHGVVFSSVNSSSQRRTDRPALQHAVARAAFVAGPAPFAKAQRASAGRSSVLGRDVTAESGRSSVLGRDVAAESGRSSALGRVVSAESGRPADVADPYRSAYPTGTPSAVVNRAIAARDPVGFSEEASRTVPRKGSAVARRLSGMVARDMGDDRTGAAEMFNHSGPSHAASQVAEGQAGRSTASSEKPGMLVALQGDLVLDGRKLGRMIATGQTSVASLPTVSGSAVNLRAMPIFSGTSAPL